MGYDIDYRKHGGGQLTVGEDNPFPVRIYDGSGNAGATVPVSVADGADVAQGTTTDAAVTTDAAGSLSGKLRGLVKLLTTAARVGCSFGLDLNSSAPSSLQGSIAMPADGDAETQAHLQWQGIGTLRYYVRGMLFNGTTWDKKRNNVSGTVLASAARTSTTNGPDTTSYNARALTLIVDVSAIGTGSMTPSLQLKDSVSGNYFTVWTAAAPIASGATFAYRFEAGASGGSWTEKLAFGIPGRTYRFVCSHNNANPMTYSVSEEKQ